MEFLPGEMVEICLDGLIYTVDGFATGGSRDGGLALFESVDLATYPSSNDFHGDTTVVSDGDRGVIIRHVGRPQRINRDPAWFKYDVYEIFVNNSVRCIFRQNIRKIKE
mgnify:CR=1 FL=1